MTLKTLLISVPGHGQVKIYDLFRGINDPINPEILRELDKEKPVCLFLQGSSLHNWKKIDPPFNEHSDCVFASLNNFKPVDNILKNINRRVELLWCASKWRYEQTEQDIYDFIENKGILFTTSTMFINLKLKKTLRNQGNIILSDYGFGLNSLSAFLLTLGVYGWKKVYLFGADGAVDSSIGQYYQEVQNDKEVDYSNNNYNQRSVEEFDYGSIDSVVQDTNFLNSSWKQIYEYAQDYLKIPYLVPKNIVNVNNSSHLTCFDIISEDDFRKQFGELITNENKI